MALQFAGTLKKIYRGGDTARARRWVAADYIDRVLLASSSAPALFWPGTGDARPIPGLTDSDGYDGVEVFDDHVLLWRDATLKWSHRGDFGLWIPVGVTAAVGSAVLESDLTMTAAGAGTAPAYLTGLAGEFVARQFLRIVSYDNDPTKILYDYFRVRSAALSQVLNRRTIKRAQSARSATKTRIYLTSYDTYLDWTPGMRVKINGVASNLRITACSRNANYSAQSRESVLGGGPVVPAVGETMVLNMERIVSEALTGDIVSLGNSDAPGQDLYEITTPASFAVTMKRLGVGDKQPGTIWPSGTYVSFQNWVEVENPTTVDVPIPPEADISVVDAVVLEPLGLTGGTTPGAKIPAGASVESVDANEAGEVLNVGSTINGPIYGVVALAEYAYILKRRSIQSIQSVGQAAGTFFIRPEILDEGPAGRYSWCRASDREVCFIGNKGVYLYAGGQNLRPVAQQHWESFRDEVDWARVDEIVAHHNRRQNEVWFVYPSITGATKVFIWNYVEDSVVVDNYPDSLNGITALGRVEWELAPTWDSLDTSEKCNGAAKRWYEYIDVAEREYTLMGVGGDVGSVALGEDPDDTYPRLLIHGRVWSRSSNDDCSPDPIPSFAETPDFDFGDPKVWKYVDTVFLALNQRSGVPSGAKMKVYIGARDNLNSPIRWSSGQDISITEAGAGPTKINTTVSGRYIRVRFESETVGADWGVSGYHIIARRGGTY